jgi:hypothetical protein
VGTNVWRKTLKLFGLDQSFILRTEFKYSSSLIEERFFILKEIFELILKNKNFY